MNEKMIVSMSYRKAGSELEVDAGEKIHTQGFHPTPIK